MMEFSRNKNQYVFTAAGINSHKAKFLNSATTGEEVGVGIKIFDVYQIKDVYSFTTNLYNGGAFNHHNIAKVHCSFMADNRLWVIMSLPGTPMRSVIQLRFRKGLPEKAVAFVLNETLKGLHYLHHEKNVGCKNLGARCVCLDDEYRVKIGISSITYEDHNPEVLKSGYITYFGDGESKVDDIVMFGFFALELYYGEVPSLGDVKRLLGEVKLRRSRGLSCLGAHQHHRRRRRIPRGLAEVVEACLCRDRDSRPTTTQLMEFSYFQARIPKNVSLEKLMKKR